MSLRDEMLKLSADANWTDAMLDLVDHPATDWRTALRVLLTGELPREHPLAAQGAGAGGTGPNPERAAAEPAASAEA